MNKIERRMAANPADLLRVYIAALTGFHHSVLMRFIYCKCWQYFCIYGCDLYLCLLNVISVLIICNMLVLLSVRILLLPHRCECVVPAHPGSPWQRAFKRLCVCVCVFLWYGSYIEVLWLFVTCMLHGSETWPTRGKVLSWVYRSLRKRNLRPSSTPIILNAHSPQHAFL